MILGYQDIRGLHNRHSNANLCTTKLNPYNEFWYISLLFSLIKYILSDYLKYKLKRVSDDERSMAVPQKAALS
jgi:hypothetical protein